MQTSYWAEVKSVDWQAHYLIFKDQHKIVAAGLLLERKAFLQYSFFYCPRGFVLDYTNEVLVKEVLALAKEYVKNYHGFVLRFDPDIAYQITDTRSKEVICSNKDVYEMLGKYAKSTGLQKDMDSSSQPRFQMAVNLKNGSLLDKVKTKKRRLVKEEYLAARGFEVYENTTVEGIKEFARLEKITETRQNVALRNEAYFLRMYEAFKPDDLLKVYMVRVNMTELIAYNETLSDKEEEIKRLAALKQQYGNLINTNAIICVMGTPMVQMFYGASDDAFARYKPGYRLHFYAMQRARELGYAYFNMGGVSGSLNDGLYRFKAEFGPELIEYVGDFDVVCHKFIYFLFTKGLAVYKKIRH